MIPQSPWIERKFEFNFPVGLFPVIIDRLRGTLPRIENIIQDKTDGALGEQQNGWSVKEQVGHLYDLEELWYGRIEDFLSGKEILRAADMTNEKTHQANHNSKNIVALLELFSTARNKLIAKVENIDERTASSTALHPACKNP